ncbi:hypothetical protein FRC00_008064 [Tulasnella sp. 408]|nr:hypothetical protein FRC00_008064 [Tulasnella sp. 408]
MDFSSGGNPGRIQIPQLARNRPSIHDLPIELLSHIISLSVQNYFASITRMQNLCLVCSRWRDVVEGTPELWCRITSADPLPGVRKAIDSSRDYPLDIGYGNRAHPNRSGPEDFLSAVYPHAWRWRRASIVLGLGSENLLQRWTAGKAPRLESLTITLDTRVPTPLTLFEGAPLPCLRTLQLRSVPLVWDGQQLFNLRKLEILAEKQIPPSLSSVLSVLRETHRLEDFVCVGSLSQTPGDESDAVPQHSIPLPALKKLRIHSSAKSSWLGLSRAIRAPACQHVSLAGGLLGDLQDPTELAQIVEGVSQFLPRLRTRAEWEERVHITLGSPNVTFRSSTFHLDFSHSTRRMQLAKWMILNLVDELVEIALYIIDPTWNAAQLEMLDLPTLRRTVSKLNISPTVWQPRAILEYLSSPTPGLDGQALWPLPNLTELAVPVNADDLAVILRMLRCRAQAIELPGSVRPQTIIELRLTEYAIGSLDDTERMSEIDSFMRGNGGSLKIVPWGG